MEIVISSRPAGGGRRVQIFLDEETKVEQHHLADVNINSIMKKFEKTGQLPDQVMEAVYGDFSGGQDFHEAHNSIIAAKEMFNSLPASVRNKFENDPGQLLDFVGDPENIEEARKLGLLPKGEPEVSAEAEPTVEAPKPVPGEIGSSDPPDEGVKPSKDPPTPS